MTVKRLHDGFGIGEDCCVSGRHPMRAEDPPGVYLGANPESPSKGLFLAHYIAEEVAQKLGYPPLAVYEAQKELLDQQVAEISELERRLDEEVHSLQLKAVLTAVTNSKKDVVNAVEGYSSAVRARLGGGGSDAKSVEGAGVGSPDIAKGVSGSTRSGTQQAL